jgi:hypothetical protein
MGSECKEKGILFYKVFKLFFIEQEKKWYDVINEMKIKINYFKELSKTVIQQKNKQLQRVEKLNDILFAERPSYENLQDHKMLINDLLLIINEKRDQIYLIQSECMTFQRELNFWIYDYDKIKLDNKLRDKVKELDNLVMEKNIHDELSHKK